MYSHASIQALVQVDLVDLEDGGEAQVGGEEVRLGFCVVSLSHIWQQHLPTTHKYTHKAGPWWGWGPPPPGPGWGWGPWGGWWGPPPPPYPHPDERSRSATANDDDTAASPSPASVK